MLLSCPIPVTEMEVRKGLTNLGHSFANRLPRMVLFWLSGSSENSLTWLVDDADDIDVGSPDVCGVSLLPAFSNAKGKLKTSRSGVVSSAYPNPDAPCLPQLAVSHLPIHPAIQLSLLMCFKNKLQTY